ncbi:MAG: glycoside hydrolase, partial [Chitinophagaceae bacterium]|nr:glycoside hydrolase [Rubrivivax sp.]
GVCTCASRIPLDVLKNRPEEAYWAAGADGQRQLMKWYSVGPHNIGTYWEAGDIVKGFDWMQTDPGFLRRQTDPKTGQPFQVIGLFGYGGDDLARKTGVSPPPPLPEVPGLQGVPSSPYTDHFHLLARQWTHAQRQVISSNQLDYFADLEATHGANLPTRSVTFGNEWDLYSASMAETSARVKRAVEQLRSAELLAALVSLKYPRFMDNHATARDEAYTDLGLYWEHNWTADGPVTRGQRASWHQKLAANIEYHVDSVHAEGLLRLGGMIGQPQTTAAGPRVNRFFVLNALGWPRSEFADHLHTGLAEVHVVDVSTGQQVLHQLVRIDGTPHIRILAPDVPSAGYKVFELRPGPGTPPAGALAQAADIGPAAADGSRVFENGSVKLVVARDGAVLSLVDKRRGDMELAATIDGLALNDLAAHTDEGDALTVDNAGPVSVTLRARSNAGLPHSTAITLYRDSDRIDIRNTIDANFGDVRHWAFSFNLAQPAVHSEEVGAINLNKRQAEGGDYADTHARYDHITLNHFAQITAGDGAHGVTLSNPDLAFAQLGRSTADRLDTQTPQIKVLAGGQVDGPNLGIRRQNGASFLLQRFALRPTAGHDPVAAMTFALQHQNPLLAAPVLPKSTGVYPADQFSLLHASDPNVLLWAVKPADGGIDQGLVLRLWNLSDKPARTVVSLHSGIASAWRATHIETDLEPVALMPPAAPNGTHRLPASFARQQLQTFRLLPPPAARGAGTAASAP